MKNRSDLDLTEGPILRKLLLFAFPLFFEQILNSLYATADTVMMGQFAGANAMAAVGACSSPVNLFIQFFTGIAAALCVSCSNLLGARNKAKLTQCMHTGLIMGFFAGCIITLLGLFSSEPLLRLMGTPEDILADATTYMTVRLSLGPIWFVGVFGRQILYAHGNTRLPTVTGMISGLVNVGLNFLFVPVLGMGVAGVALATAIVGVINAAVMLPVLFSPKGEYRMSLRLLRVDWGSVRNVLTVGIPIGVNNILYPLSNTLLQSSVNSFGSLVVAGNTASDNLTSYTLGISTAFSNAVLAGASRCYGAHNYKRIDEIIRKSILFATFVVAVMAGFSTVFGKMLLGLFNPDPAVSDAGYPKLLFVCWGYVLYTPSKMLTAGLKSIRRASASLFCDVFSIIAPRILWVMLVVPKMHTPNMLYMIYPICYALSAVLLAVTYTHYRRKIA